MDYRQIINIEAVKGFCRDNRGIIRLSITGFLMIFLYFILKPVLLTGGSFNIFITKFLNIYEAFLFRMANIIFQSFGTRVHFWPEFHYLIWAGGASEFGIPFLSLRHSFIFVVFLVVFHKKIKSTIVWLLAGMAVFLLMNILRIIAVVYVPADTFLVRNFFRAILSLGLLYVLLNRIKKDSLLSGYYKQLMSFLKQKLILNPGTMVFLFLTWEFISGLYKAVFPKELLVKIILQETAWIIRLFGAEPRIDGRYIFIRRTWVFLGDACLGIMLIFTYIILLLMLRARLTNKLIAVFGGTIIITLINSARIAAISFHLQNHGGVFSPEIDPHQLFSYMVYTAVFIMWVIFIIWGRGVDKINSQPVSDRH